MDEETRRKRDVRIAMVLRRMFLDSSIALSSIEREMPRIVAALENDTDYQPGALKAATLR